MARKREKDPIFMRADKYRIVASILRGKGTLLDIGARDGVLRQFLDPSFTYYAADVNPGLDYELDLEFALPFSNAAFDFVVALDVLEHVENIHNAFSELARIARKYLVISLPNFSSMRRRCLFLLSGHLGTHKYDLLPAHQGDRHRWLTSYSQMNRFVQINSERVGSELVQVIEQSDGGRFGYCAARLLKRGLFTGRCIYVMKKKEHA